MTANEIIREVKETEVLNQYEAMSDSEKVEVWNEYCDEIGYTDDQIFQNDEDFFQTFFDRNDMMRVIQATFYGHYHYTDDWVQFNGYANLDTSDDPTDLMHWQDNDICEWVIDGNGGFYSFNLDDYGIEAEINDRILDDLRSYDYFVLVNEADYEDLVDYCKEDEDMSLEILLEDFINENYPQE